MKKSNIVLLLFCFITISIYGRNIITQERTIGVFSGISVCCGIDVYLSEGSSRTLTVETDAETMERVEAFVDKGVLHISVKKKDSEWFKRNNNSIAVYVKASNLTYINASSGSDIKGQTDIKAKDIEISAGSAGDIELTLYAVNVKCSAGSGSDIKLKGKATYANISASSGSDILMEDFSVLKADAKASSGSDINITVKEEINAKANSGADIDYYGNPTIVNVSSSSGGSITRKR